MERTLSSQLKNQAGKEVMLQGWLHTLRKLGSIAFLILRDRKGLAQIVLDEEAEITKLHNLYTGTILQVNGIVQASPKSKF